jgi:hypothetical protein
MAIRAVQGAFTYFICVTVLFFTSPYPRDFPIFFGLIAGTTYLASILRGILIWQRKRIYTWNRRAWQIMFFLTTQAAAAAWGLLLCVSNAKYGFQSWTTLLIMILATASAFGATIVMVPRLNWLTTHVVSLLGPGVVTCIWIGHERRSRTLFERRNGRVSFQARQPG